RGFALPWFLCRNLISCPSIVPIGMSPTSTNVQECSLIRSDILGHVSVCHGESALQRQLHKAPHNRASISFGRNYALFA
ncbi:hypothetical protein FRB93_010514, partial [Tulasnella sp. JGI-2019a]